MFHWICPECGREIAPAVRECPACDPHAALALAAEPVMEPVAAEPVSPPPLSEGHDLQEAIDPVPEHGETCASAGPEAPEAEPVLAEPDAPVPDDLPTLELEIPVSAQVAENEAPAETAPLSEPVCEPLLEPPPEPEPVAADYPELVPDPLLALALKLREEQHEPQPEPAITEMAEEPEAALAPVAASVDEDIPDTQQTVGPEQLETIPATEELAAADETATAADQAIAQEMPAPAEMAAPAEITAPAAVALAVPGCEPLALADKPSPDPEPITESRPSSERQIPNNGASWIRPMLAVGTLQEYSAAAKRRIVPIPPANAILKPDSGPRITLPGPALTPQLTSLQAAGLSRILTERAPKPPSKSAYGWLVTLMVMMALLLVGVLILFAMVPRPPAPAQSAAVPHEPVAEAAPATPPVETAGVASSYPLSKTVEVTGFRFLVDASKKPEVHYLVVNHSSGELSDMTVFVTLHAANPKPGQPPLCRFSFRPAGLKPYESKEMVSAIQKLPAGLPLPDWQDLRADVELSQ